MHGERREYYKAHGVTLAVTTCDCCRWEGCQDAWEYRRDGAQSVGISSRTLRDCFTLITEKEARKRVSRLGLDATY